MKKITSFSFGLLSSIFCFFSISSSAQVDWSTSGGGLSNENSTAVALDDSGNVFLSGVFDSAATFGSTTLYSNAEPTAIYLNKYSSTGILKWSKVIARLDKHSTVKQMTRTAHYIYIYGGMPTVFVSGTDSITDTLGVMFIIKLTMNGGFVWEKSYHQITGKLSFISAACDDGSDGLYFTGRLRGQVTIGANTYGTTGNTRRVFIAHINSAGNVSWFTVSSQSGGNSRGAAISKRSNGNLLVTGFYQDSLIIGSQICADAGSNGLLNTNMFIAEFTNAGVCNWINGSSTSGKNSNGGLDITEDGTGNIYASGIIADTTTINAQTFIADSVGNGFLAKYSTGGVLIWGKILGQANPMYANSMSGVHADATGNIFVTGTIADSSMLDTNAVFTNGNRDIIAMKINSSGTVLNNKIYGGSLNEGTGQSIMDANGNIFVAGIFASKTAMMPGNNITNHDVAVDTTNDAFVFELANWEFTDVANFSSSTSVSVFPNPTTGEIKFDNSQLKANEISVYDLSGKLLQNKTISKDKIASINISNLTSGIYFLKIISRTKSFEVKIIKQ